MQVICEVEKYEGKTTFKPVECVAGFDLFKFAL